MNIRKDIRFRVYVAFTGICFMGALIIAKAAMIQTQEGEELRAHARNVAMRNDTLYSERGNIYTEAGDLLCSSIPIFDISLDFSVIKKDTFLRYRDTLADGISAILQKRNSDEVKARLNAGFKAGKKYFPLCRNIAYDDYQQMRRLPIFNKGQRRGGFIAESKTKRIYPYEELAKRTIGRWKKGTPSLGLEAAYNDMLRGANGSRLIQKRTGGVWMPIEGSEVDARNGYDIVTTIDLDIQNVAEHAMMSILNQYKCLNGSCIVMETATGKIRGMVNLGRDKETGRYIENQNYALLSAEPGSTFKAATLLSLLKDGYINVEDNVNCFNGSKAFVKRTMLDSHHGLGVMPIREAYAHSSNVAMAWLAFQHYYKNPKQFIDRLHELGVDEKTGIDLIGEPEPRVTKPGSKEWGVETLPWMATGYGIVISPLRTCMIYNAIANNGKMMRPYLISSIKEYGRPIKEFAPEVVHVVGDSSAISQMKSCTREVVLSGTGRSIASPYYQISGKTGTAQVADKIDGKWYGYKDGVYQGSFVGYFPSDKPKYTMMVMIRTAPHSGSYYGGTVAAPVFRMIADRIFANGMGSWDGPLDSIASHSKKTYQALPATMTAYQRVTIALGLPCQAGKYGADRMMLPGADSVHQLQLKPLPLPAGQMPDLTKMALKDALYILENQGINVRVNGRGTIATQSIAPGTKISKGQTIILTLS